MYQFPVAQQTITEKLLVFFNILSRSARSISLKVTLLHECFSRFLNCTNGTKSRNTSHMRASFIHDILPNNFYIRYLKK